ncbi:hypothetical protein [Thermoanaerobacter mathranii]|uniref:recombination directionality factor n=1 Tax=Thermoanaerobacter mathranii TaxID=583357 RepID=UPI003D6C3A52
MIKGLSEIRKLPRIGKIRLGVKSKTVEGTQYPTAVDYFVIDEKNTPKNIAEKIKKLYGEKPQKLRIKFFSNDLEQVFPQFLKYYQKGTLICRGDGEKALRRKENGEIKEITCQYKNCPYYQQKLCKPIGHLKFYLDGIPGGFFQIDTSSVNSIININTRFEQIKTAHGGNIINVPLEIVLSPIQIQVKTENNKNFNRTVYIIDINDTTQNNSQITKEKFEEILQKEFEDTFKEEFDEEFNEEFSKDNEAEIPEGFDIAEDEEDPFAEDSNQKSPKEMLVLDKFSKIQIKGKDYVMATFLDSQNKKYNFIITNKEIYIDLNTAKKSGKNPVIYNYRTENFEGYEVLMEYKKLV